MTDIYRYTIPVFVKALGGLRAVLDKAAAHPGLDEPALITSALAPDMFPFAKQVQMACDNAKLAAARLTGIEAPKNEDTETTLAALRARVDATLAFLATITPESFAAAASRQITLPYFPGKFMTGEDYAREYALPNFFFHDAMAYALVRKAGIAIGKADYLNGLPLTDL